MGRTRPKVRYEDCPKNSGAKNFMARMKPNVVTSINQKSDDKRKFFDVLCSPDTIFITPA